MAVKLYTKGSKSHLPEFKEYLAQYKNNERVIRCIEDKLQIDYRNAKDDDKKMVALSELFSRRQGEKALRKIFGESIIEIRHMPMDKFYDLEVDFVGGTKGYYECKHRTNNSDDYPTNDIDRLKVAENSGMPITFLCTFRDGAAYLWNLKDYTEKKKWVKNKTSMAENSKKIENEKVCYHFDTALDHCIINIPKYVQ